MNNEQKLKALKRLEGKIVGIWDIRGEYFGKLKKQNEDCFRVIGTNVNMLITLKDIFIVSPNNTIQLTK